LQRTGATATRKHSQKIARGATRATLLSKELHMAFDVVMFGAVTLPEMNVEEWLSTPIEPSEFAWLDEVAGAEVVHDTPEALLAALSETVCTPHETGGCSCRRT
jgi:hypothetical protein